MVILGIDPGYATIGYGVIERTKPGSRAIDYGVITTPAGISLPRRLQMAADAMEQLIARHNPKAIAVEELFFARNTTTAMGVAQARGVIMLCSVRCGADLYEYTPMQIKQAITGYGRADKRQMQHMVKSLLGLSEIPRPDDAADALAVALCHCQTNRFAGSFSV